MESVTPISNYIVEMFTNMRYLQSAMLERKKLLFFDAWASTFGETVTAIELKPEGSGWRAKTRFARFFNLPELMSLWREVTDIQTAEMLKLPVPKANYHVVSTKPSALQQEMVKALHDLDCLWRPREAGQFQRGNIKNLQQTIYSRRK